MREQPLMVYKLSAGKKVGEGELDWKLDHCLKGRDGP